MEEIKNDLKAIRHSIAEIDKTLAVNTESLQAHMQRTKQNEARIEWIERSLMGLAVLAVIGGYIKIFVG